MIFRLTAGAVLAVVAATLAQPAAADVNVQGRVVEHSSNVLYVVDHTEGTWFVNRAIRNWNRQPAVLLTMVGSCDGLVPCVDVFPVPSLPVGSGLAHNEGNGHWVILLNNAGAAGHGPDTWVGIRHLRRSTVCHELGHVLLGPSHTTTGCLQAMGSGDRQYRFAGRAQLDRVAAAGALRWDEFIPDDPNAVWQPPLVL